MSKPQTFSLDEYTPQQLEQINQGMQQELQMLTSSLGTLKLALSKYKFSKEALQNMEAAQEDTKATLVPLTSSLYMPGTVTNVKSVLVDVGTGYFAEKSLEASQQYFDQKAEMVIKNIENVQGALTAKRDELNKVRMVLQQKVAQQRAMQQQQQK